MPKAALVTGANSGIGEGTAKALAAAGASVVVNWVTNPDAAAQVGLTASGELINKGDVDCLVTTNGLIDGTTLNYRMSGGNPVVTKPAAIAFAKKLFQVCKDVISGK